MLRLSVTIPYLLALGSFAGCSAIPQKSPEVAENLRICLDQAGLNNVDVSQDRDKGIVTLGGRVTDANEKSQADALARSFAGVQLVTDQIAVIPSSANKNAKGANSLLDSAIERNLDAALLETNLHSNVKYEVKSAVVTLTGDVSSRAKREYAGIVATRVPNVKHVVNDLQITSHKATSSL